MTSETTGKSETWRVVLATGEVREVQITRGGGGWSAQSGAWGTFPQSSPAEAVRAFLTGFAVYADVREILAPGEPTRAEAIEAARREGAEAMREACAARFIEQAEELSEEAREWDRGANHVIAADCDRRARTARAAADAIRALPLPGEVTP